MSFFSELSPVGKGAVVFAVVILVYLGIANVAAWPPFAVAKGVTHTRGVH
ncbi:MAG: hypothetical protein R3A78_01245 [Polyangiales bacterium]|nr:hypothetical protein [Myxococcales bacterium]